jgi:putative sigma-54 modulation protein
MKIAYTGKDETFTKEQQKKLDVKFQRIGKLVDRKGEKKAQITITGTRHLRKADITMQIWDHPLVSKGQATDLFTAVSEAVDKLEKQLQKMREKWRDSKRDPRDKPQAVAARPPAPVRKARIAAPPVVAVVAEATAKKSGEARRVYRADGPVDHKPMTLDEALLAMGKKQTHFAFIDAQSGELAVLVRRDDGHFDLIEA